MAHQHGHGHFQALRGPSVWDGMCSQPPRSTLDLGRQPKGLPFLPPTLPTGCPWCHPVPISVRPQTLMHHASSRSLSYLFLTPLPSFPFNIDAWRFFPALLQVWSLHQADFDSFLSIF